MGVGDPNNIGFSQNLQCVLRLQIYVAVHVWVHMHGVFTNVKMCKQIGPGKQTVISQLNEVRSG